MKTLLVLSFEEVNVCESWSRFITLLIFVACPVVLAVAANRILLWSSLHPVAAWRSQEITE